mgnify:CR=1 FL=1
MFNGVQDGEIVKVSLFAPTRKGEYETVREKTGEKQSMLHWGERQTYCLCFLVMSPDQDTGAPSTHWLTTAVRRCMRAKYPEIGNIEIVDVTDRNGQTHDLFSKFLRGESPPESGERLSQVDLDRVYWVRLRLTSVGPERDRPNHWDPIGDTREEIKQRLNIS